MISRELARRLEGLGEESAELGEIMEGMRGNLELELDKRMGEYGVGNEGKLLSTPINIDLRRHQIKNMLGECNSAGSNQKNPYKLPRNS